MMRACLAAVLFLSGASSCSTESQSISAQDGFVTVRVSDSTGKPAVGARVYYLDRSRLDVRAAAVLELALVSEENAKAWVLASAETNSHGEARIPHASDVGDVGVEYGTEFGTATLGSGASTVAVRLERDRSRRVRVIDESGKPVVGTTVILMAARPTKPDQEMRSLGVPVWAGRSHAPDGTAEIHHVKQIEKLVPNATQLRLYAKSPEFVGVLTDAYSVAFHLDEEDPLTLTVPAPGQVMVRVHQRDGSPAPPNTAVELAAKTDLQAIADPDRNDRAEMEDEGSDNESFPDTAIAVHGMTTFSGVWLDRSFEITARAWDGTRRGHALIRGPRTAGEIVNVDVELGERLPTLTGRLLGKDGAPIRWSQFEASWASGENPKLGLDPYDQSTDGEGRFKMDLEETPPIDPERPPALEFWFVNDSGASKHPSHWAMRLTVPVTKPLEPGDIDLGDIRLTSGPAPASAP
jgi:hypothetical protein